MTPPIPFFAGQGQRLTEWPGPEQGVIIGRAFLIRRGGFI